MKKYINLSLCGCKERILDKSELDSLELGFYKDEIVANVKDDNWNDWTEIVFLLEESVPVPVELDTKSIYDLVCSWCVNVAFGTMDCYDSKATLDDIALQLDSIDKGEEFRKISDLNYLRGQFEDRDWEDFEPEYIRDEEIDGYESMDEEELQKARDELIEGCIKYNIYEYLREVNQPFGTMSSTEAEELLMKYLTGEESEKSSWYGARR